MKKVFFTIAFAFLLVGLISSCTPESVEDQDARYSGIDNGEVKETDI